MSALFIAAARAGLCLRASVYGVGRADTDRAEDDDGFDVGELQSAHVCVDAASKGDDVERVRLDFIHFQVVDLRRRAARVWRGVAW